MPHEVVELRPRDIRLADVREAIRITELTEYGDIINAVVSVPLFRRSATCGVKVVLTGDGSDELFGGYPMYHQVGPAAARRLFLHKIRNLCRTELQRVDRAAMAHGVEARVPFLDLSVVELAMRLPLDLKLRDGQEKWIVRRAFADVLPDYILRRAEEPDVVLVGAARAGPAVQAAVRPAAPLVRLRPAEPVRRDFDTVLAGLRTTTWTGPSPTPRTPRLHRRWSTPATWSVRSKWNVINGVRATRRRLTRR